MKNKNIKSKKILVVFFSLLVLILSAVTFHVTQEKFQVQTINQNPKYPANLFYKVFSYSNYHNKIQEYYQERAKEISKIENKDQKKNDIKEKVENEKPIEEDNPLKIVEEETITISSSLTSTSGVISVNGATKGVKVFYLNQLISKNNQEFSFTAGPTFSVRLEGKRFKTNLTISSPSYGTNKIISQLTLQVNPITMTATIIGQLHLMLPGEITGSFYNLTNSSSSSTILKNGYFATSVVLQEGRNLLSASGQWYTIKLDLPSLEVIVTK